MKPGHLLEHLANNCIYLLVMNLRAQEVGFYKAKYMTLCTQGLAPVSLPSANTSVLSNWGRFSVISKEITHKFPEYFTDTMAASIMVEEIGQSLVETNDHLQVAVSHV